MNKGLSKDWVAVALEPVITALRKEKEKTLIEGSKYPEGSYGDAVFDLHLKMIEFKIVVLETMTS